MSRSGETRSGLTDSQSAQTHPLECTVHRDDDDSYDWNDDNGHPQKNSPNYVRKEVLVGAIGARFEPHGEPEVGLICMKSAQTPSPILILHDDNDNCDDCDHDNGQPQKNLPKDVQKEVLIGRRSIRCYLLESPKCVSHA